MSFDSRRVQEAIRAAAIAHPGSHEQRPWNPPAFTVYKKALVFVGGPGGRVAMSLKLRTVLASACMIQHGLEAQ